MSDYPYAIVSATELRNRWGEVLDNAERGIRTLVIRNSRPVAAIVPASDALVEDASE